MKRQSEYSPVHIKLYENHTSALFTVRNPVKRALVFLPPIDAASPVNCGRIPET